MDFDKVLDLVRAMNDEGVAYKTFGAVALNLQGIVRATTDADFFIKPDRDNIERLKRALRRVWDDPEIEQISADDLLGDYPSVCTGRRTIPSASTFSRILVRRCRMTACRPRSSWLKEKFGFEE